MIGVLPGPLAYVPPSLRCFKVSILSSTVILLFEPQKLPYRLGRGWLSGPGICRGTVVAIVNRLQPSGDQDMNQSRHDGNERQKWRQRWAVAGWTPILRHRSSSQRIFFPTFFFQSDEQEIGRKTWRGPCAMAQKLPSSMAVDDDLSRDRIGTSPVARSLHALAQPWCGQVEAKRNMKKPKSTWKKSGTMPTNPGKILS